MSMGAGSAGGTGCGRDVAGWRVPPPSAVHRAERSRGSSAPGLAWTEAAPAPVVLVSGTEDLLAERAVDRVVALRREQDPQIEVARLDAADYAAGSSASSTSPSLFAEDKVVVVAGVERATDELLSGRRWRTCAAPAPDVVLVAAARRRAARQAAARRGCARGGPDRRRASR